MTEQAVRRRLQRELAALGCHSFIAETICAGFPDLLLSHQTGNYLIELKVSAHTHAPQHWLRLFEGIQLYHLHKLHHASALIYTNGHPAVLCRVLAARDEPRFKLEMIADIQTPQHLLETLAGLRHK